MKRILLVDVDSKIPNIALMKLSTHYKNKGYGVDLKKLGYNGYPNKKEACMVFAEAYDKVFVSIVFSQNKDVVNVFGCDDVSFGGSGYDLTIKLTKEVDDCIEDYSIYPENDKSYGFLTRGCIRNCYFCFVPKKEGMIHKYRNVDDIVKHKVTMFLDNNILAYKDHLDILWELVNKKIRCQFNQGLDIRLIDFNNAKLLSKLNYQGEYIFAFDQLKDLDLIENKLKIVKKYITKDWKIKMFIFVSPEMDLKTDIMFRVNWCKDNKILPYIMRHTTCWEDDKNEFFIDLSAYCNQPALFKKLSFTKFLDKRHTTESRKEKTLNILEREIGVNNE